MFGIRRIHRDVGAAGGKIGAFENQVPGLAAIGRLVETAIGRIAPERARHRRINRVAVFWTNDDLCDAFRVGQTGMRPGFAAIGRFVDAVADRDAVARPRFTRADPDVLRILRVERDRADRLHRLFVEDRSIMRAAVFGFPNAAAGRADKDRDLARWLAVAGDGGDASAHRGRADVARAQAGDGRRVKWRFLCATRNYAKKQ